MQKKLLPWICLYGVSPIQKSFGIDRFNLLSGMVFYNEFAWGRKETVTFHIKLTTIKEDKNQKHMSKSRVWMYTQTQQKTMIREVFDLLAYFLTWKMCLWLKDFEYDLKTWNIRDITNNQVEGQNQKVSNIFFFMNLNGKLDRMTNGWMRR